MGLHESAARLCALLTSKGFLAYFAGGFVRDKLLGIDSNDIDIATNATPDEIVLLFSDTVCVGAQFGVVLVRFEGFQFEVATFRSDTHYVDGRHPSHVLFQHLPEEDVKRRDFTINGMLYDPVSGQILDFVQGQKDLRDRCIRTIGIPHERFHEDRLRMVRAIRFAVRFGFTIEAATQAAIQELAPSLFPSVSMERIYLELCKMHEHSICTSLVLLASHGLLQVIFPPLAACNAADIEHRLAPIAPIAQSLPLLLVVTQLFTENDDPFVRALPVYLKTAKSEEKWTELYLSLRSQILPSLSDHRLAHLAANPHFFPCVRLLAARLNQPSLLTWYQETTHLLAPFVERIRIKEPLISSDDIKQLGILPGPHMGLLLRQAEEFCINNHISNKSVVLQWLATRLNAPSP